MLVSEGGTRSRTYSYAQLAHVRLDAVEQITLLREQASSTPRKWSYAAAFSARAERNQKRYTFAFEGDSGFASHGYLVQHLMRRLADHDALGYGMVFRWIRPSDPLFYAAGLGYSHHNTRNAPGPPVWRLHLHGKFRDVYPMNFHNPNWREMWEELTSVILFYVVVEAITMVSWVFNYVYVMTNGQGGPGDATMVSELYIYQNAFQYQAPEIAAAAATILFGVTLVLIAVFFQVQRRTGVGIDE